MGGSTRSPGSSTLSEQAIPASFALAAAVSWGVSDFGGGVGAKGADAANVVFVAQAAGLAVLLLAVLAVGEPMPSSAALLWGAASGLGAAAGHGCFYRALAIGRMGVNAPVAAVVTCALACLIGAWTEGPPGAVQLVGFALAAASIWLLTVSAGRTAGLGLAVCAGVAFAAYLVCSERATAESLLWPLIAARVTSVAGLGAWVLARGGRWSTSPWCLITGVFDALANVLFAYAVRHGRLDVATVLSGFYPGVTVLCARSILKEPISALQAVGIAVASIAVPLIAIRFD